ncbi:ABC transporter ATP-binding protein [Methanolobus psychrotolerans]|uniref:ABC transporter ATP-binding protein n=1 Tax=Methanolobus psychrotolerans TaxID=1874706 RepID=UPI000B91AFEE|nr:ABC transporter ATP-binding protein [Methanolobus psychrotolerans]
MDLILEVDSLAYSYGNGPVFENVSFSMGNGEVMCVLGPNGAGKSTLIKCIAGIFKPAAGSVRIMGEDTRYLASGTIAKKVGYVPQQNETVFPFNVLDFVVMGRTPHLSLFASPGEEDMKIARRSLEKVGVEDLSDRTLNSLSGGQRQMVLIARALAQEPALLLLDEPTSHLDFGNQVLVLETVQKLAASGMSIVMNTHAPDHAFLIGTSAVALTGGRLIASGTVTSVVNSQMMSSVYGVNVAVRDIADIDRKVCFPCGSGKN